MSLLADAVDNATQSSPKIQPEYDSVNKRILFTNGTLLLSTATNIVNNVPGFNCFAVKFYKLIVDKKEMLWYYI